MSGENLDLCVADDLEHGLTNPASHQDQIQSETDRIRVVETVAALMACEGYPERDVFGVRLALVEAIANAIKHGHQGDWSRPVHMGYQIDKERVLVEVEDQGLGFDPVQVADPLTPENSERCSGRGLLLMRAFTTWLRHNERGNCVLLCKHSSAR